MRPYRKIWIDHCGEIPIDEEGRTFKIHHIDGDRSNNDISNLKCVSIKEHYEIHLTQGDLAAASYIAARMETKPEDLKEIRSKATSEMNKRLVSEGRHPSQNTNARNKLSKIASQRNREQLKDGTHNFITNNPSINRVKEGKHNWQLAKHTIPCYDKYGNYLRIPKDVFHSQTGPKDDWEYVHNTSTEGKRRKSLN